MSLLWIDGFESYNSSDNLVAAGYSLSHGSTATFNPSSSFRRGAGQGFRIPNGYSFNRPFTASTTAIIGIAWYQVDYSDGGMIAIREDNGNHHLSLRYTGTSRYLQVLRGDARNGTVLGTSTYGLPQSQWIYIEFKGTIHDTTGSFEVRVNGANILSGSNLDTRNGGSGLASAVNIGRNDVGSYYSGQILLDDFYICNDQGTVNNNFLGDCTVVQLLPSEPGDSTHFTSSGENWEQVRDSLGHDGNTSIVNSANIGNIDLYKVDPLEFTPTTIYGTSIQTTHRKDKNSLVQLRNLIKSEGNTATSIDYTSSTSFQTSTSIFETDPTNNQLWTKELLANAQIGMERTA